MKKINIKKGFTLVEILVSLSVFVVVMSICLGAILSILDMNEKTRTRKTAIDNLNFMLDSFSRTVRFGSVYHCGSAGDLSQPADCVSGGTSLTLLDAVGNRVTYAQSGSAITKSINSGTPLSVTSSEITIQSVVFRVIGSTAYASDSANLQPQVIVTITGSVGTKQKTRSSFTIETTVSQRKLDI